MEIWRTVSESDAGKFSAAVQDAPADFNIDARAHFEVSEIVPFASTLLVEAVTHRSLDCVSAIIAAGADVNVASGVGDTPLVAACRGGNLAIVQALIAAGADPSRGQQAPAGAPHSPLSALGLSAADHGADTTAAILNVLIAAGADLNTPYGPGGLRPLHIFVRGGDVCLPCVRALLAAGVDANLPTAVPDKAFTALQWAVLSEAPGITEVTQLLLENGANANVTDDLKKVLEPPLLAAAAAFQGGAFQALLAFGGNPKHKSHTRHSVLDFACRALTAEEQVQGLQIIRCILGHPDAGAVLGIKGPSGKSPLLTAVRSGFADAVHELLAAGLPITECSEGGEPLLVVAADAQSPGVLEALLVHGADVFAKVAKNARETALLAASRCPAVPTAERARGTVFGGVPGAGAVAGGRGEAATPAVASAFGDLWESCADAGQLMVCMLLRAESNTNTVCAFGGSALHRAALGGNTAIAHVLMEHATSTGTPVVMSKDGIGRTPTDVAVQQGNHDMLQLMLDHPATHEQAMAGGRNLAKEAFERRQWQVLMQLLVRPEVVALGTHPKQCNSDMLLPDWATAAEMQHPYQLNYEGASWCTFLTLLAHRSPLVAPFSGAIGVPMCHSRLLQGEPPAEPEHGTSHAPNRSWWVPAFVSGLFGGGNAAAVLPMPTAGRGAVGVGLEGTGLWNWDAEARDGSAKQRLLSNVGARRILQWLAVFPTGYSTDTSKWGADSVRHVTLMTLALVLALDRRHRLRERAAAAAEPGQTVPLVVLDALPHANWRLRRTLLLSRLGAAAAKA